MFLVHFLFIILFYLSLKKQPIIEVSWTQELDQSDS